MSPELIATVISGAALLLTFVGMFMGVANWLIKRVDARFDKVDERFDKVDERFATLERELVEIKVAIARIEGPPRRLLAAR